MTEAVILNHVSKWYGGTQALNDISFSVREGQAVVIIGPSGSGKSTLLRTINGLEHYQEGAITVNGVDVDKRGRGIRDVRRIVGMVFQQFNLYPHLSVLDNITLSPRRVLHVSKADAEAQAMTLLERVGLGAYAARRPSQLSGGEQQRVAIARALAMRPKVLLLDEITSALDPEMVDEVLQVVKELAEGGMTMILVSHEMGFASRVADKVVFLDKGALVEAGSPEKIFTNPEAERTSEFVSRVISGAQWLGDVTKAGQSDVLTGPQEPERSL
jgi:ABC-type polar amino acid transport system ATPase subunit